MEAVTTGTPAEWLQRLRQRPALVVVGVVVVLAAPYLLSGPEIMADDWVWIRNGEFLGRWDAGGSRQAGRPGAFVLYGLTFGLIGAHPLVLSLVQVGLWIVAAISVLRCLRVYIGHDVAFAVTVLWLVLPSHTTLELWASTSQAWVALILLAEGLRWVRVHPGRRWPGLVMLAFCGTFYEVVMPVVPVGLAVADRLRGGRLRLWPLAQGAVLVAPALAWSLTASTIYPDAVEGTEGEVVEHLAASLALGTPVQNPLAYAMVGIAAVVAYLALRAVRARDTNADLGLLVAGLAVVASGTVFALRSYLLPDGIGNRVTVASGIGAALFWLGAYRWTQLSQTARVLRLAVAAIAVAIVLAVRATYVWDWIDTANAGKLEAARISRMVRADSDGHVVLPDRPAVGDWTYALLDGWNATAAAQVTTGDPTVVVNVFLPDRCFETGPTKDDPLAQYGSIGERFIDDCAPADD